MDEGYVIVNAGGTLTIVPSEDVSPWGYEVSTDKSVTYWPVVVYAIFPSREAAQAVIDAMHRAVRREKG